MINLPNVELLSVNCVNPENSVKALLYSAREIHFSKITLLSHYKPENLSDHIEFIKIDRQTHNSMNVFSIKELPTYITSDYVLSIHDDGFVINPHLWSDEFLNFDYIGAPWPPIEWCKINRVGNGGFVLKSKKFATLELTLPYINGHNDKIITNDYYKYFMDNNCRYAPLDIAARFSLELEIPEVEYNLDNCFGFHGRYHPNALKKIEILNNL